MDNGFNFKECEFINNEMKFYTYEDFYEHCFVIKRLYENNLSKYGKIFYKWYVYSNVYTSMNQKNKIWDFIAGYCDKNDLIEFIKGKENERNNKDNVL